MGQIKRCQVVDHEGQFYTVAIFDLMSLECAGVVDQDIDHRGILQDSVSSLFHGTEVGQIRPDHRDDSPWMFRTNPVDSVLSFVVIPHQDDNTMSPVDQSTGGLKSYPCIPAGDYHLFHIVYLFVCSNGLNLLNFVAKSSHEIYQTPDNSGFITIPAII